MAKRNPWLTPGMHQILLQLQEDPTTDGELVREPGAGWWLGCNKVGAAPCDQLIRLCLLSRKRRGGTLEVYTLNQEGRKILQDSTYTPKIARKRPDLFVPPAATKPKTQPPY